jgi:Mg/Co/Ni transporter MgtE
VVLALFVPLIISSGGNTGSQASTLIIRALAMGDITVNEWWRIFRRESSVGLILGLILSVIGFLRVAVWSQFTTIYGPPLGRGRLRGSLNTARRGCLGQPRGFAFSFSAEAAWP